MLKALEKKKSTSKIKKFEKLIKLGVGISIILSLIWSGMPVVKWSYYSLEGIYTFTPSWSLIL